MQRGKRWGNTKYMLKPQQLSLVSTRAFASCISLIYESKIHVTDTLGYCENLDQKYSRNGIKIREFATHLPIVNGVKTHEFTPCTLARVQIEFQARGRIAFQARTVFCFQASTVSTQSTRLEPMKLKQPTNIKDFLFLHE